MTLTAEWRKYGESDVVLVLDGSGRAILLLGGDALRLDESLCSI